MKVLKIMALAALVASPLLVGNAGVEAGHRLRARFAYYVQAPPPPDGAYAAEPAPTCAASARQYHMYAEPAPTCALSSHHYAPSFYYQAAEPVLHCALGAGASDDDDDDDVDD